MMTRKTREKAASQEEQPFITLFNTERIEDYVALVMVVAILIVVLTFF